MGAILLTIKYDFCNKNNREHESFSENRIQLARHGFSLYQKTSSDGQPWKNWEFTIVKQQLDVGIKHHTLDTFSLSENQGTTTHMEFNQ